MTKEDAEKLVASFERAVRDSCHKLANEANHHDVRRKRNWLVDRLVNTGE